MERIKRVAAEWEDHRLLHRGRMEARAHFGRWADAEAALRGDEAERLGALSLNGEWKFLHLEGPELSPEGFESEAFDDSAWDDIPVPSHWQLQGYGKPHYTDVYYQFPVDPPFVPRDNPTGIYRRRFRLGPSAGRRILRFHGVDSAYHVWVNGRALGYSKVARMTAEFDATDLLREGENTITVCVYQWSDGTYLEDQDMWWLS
ncbi:MAG: beta galactosidase small chain, partial [Spirochaetaceae bacterium]|nr:beta galactosidase small chain [Spirochaetaceae bacterium]